MRSTPVLVAALASGLTVLTGCGGARPPTAAAATIPDPPTTPMPPAGSYRLHWVQDHAHPITGLVPGLRMGAGQRPQRVWVQVDYAGPRHDAELVALNTIDGKASEPIVFYSEKYGAAELEISGSNARSLDGEPLSRPRQTFVIDIFALQDCPGRTALASVCTFDSVERGFYDAVQSQFYMAVFDSAHRSNRVSFGDGPIDKSGSRAGAPGPTEPISDAQATTLFYVQKDAVQTEIQLRFR